MLEKYGKLDWEVDLCDPDFIDELQAKWAAEAVVKAQEEKRQEYRNRLNERIGK